MPTYYTFQNMVGSTIVVKVVDGEPPTFIPSSEGNSDYAAYLEWLAEGNTPEPWPPAE